MAKSCGPAAKPSGLICASQKTVWRGRSASWLLITHMLEREGFTLVVEKKKSESTCAMVYGEIIRFGLIERSRQVKPSPKPSASSPYSYNPIRLEPTGMLSIEMWNYYGRGLQKTWRDRESARA